MSDTWRCGHPKTAENTKAASPSTGPRCLSCHRDRLTRWRQENTNKGTGRRGRPMSMIDTAPIGWTEDDVNYRAMVRYGTQQLGAAIDRLLGRSA